MFIGQPASDLPPDRRQSVRTKVTVKAGPQRHHGVTRRPRAGALLTVTLINSRLDRPGDGRSRMGVLGGRDRGQSGDERCQGSARAAARRAPKGAEAELLVRPG